MNFANVQVISFDCYGTLIDWETGITSSMQRVLRAHGIRVSDDDILHTYSRLEPASQDGVYQPYRQVLRAILLQFASAYGFRPSASEQNELVESLPSWDPFPDTVTALRALKKRFRLAILSNIDNDLLAATAQRLEAVFDLVITAEDLKSYKPKLAHFQTLLARTGLPPANHLHAAESLYHDIAPASALGIPNVWVKRRHGERAANASQKAPVQPDYIVRDLAELVTLVGCEP
jgi:2-haloacid dehalogenase